MASSLLSRRNVLRGLGGITVALPFLESLVNPRKVARAGTSSRVGFEGRPKRFVAWVNMFGTLPQFHRVEHNGTELYFPSTMGPDPLGSKKDGAPEYFNVYNPEHWPHIETASTQEPLAAIKKHMTVLKGVNMPSVVKARGLDQGVGHVAAQCHALTAWPDRLVKHPWDANGVFMPIPKDAPTDGDGYNNWGQCYPSIDQAIANRIDWQAVKHRSLNIGDNLDHTAQVFYGQNQDIGNAIWNPVNLFQLLFSESQKPQDQMLALRDQRRSVLDLVLAEASEFKGRVSKRDLQTIEAHFDAIRDIEKGLDIVTSCAVPAGMLADFEGVQTWDQLITKGLGTKRYELFFKLLALALKCDLTRVAGVQFFAHTVQASEVTPASLGVTPVNGSNAHEYSHAPWGDLRNTEVYRHILRWKNKVFADFVLDLESTMDGNEHTVLDNTVIFHTSDMLTAQHETTPSQMWGYNNRAGDPSVYCQNGKADGNSPERARGLNMFYVGSGGGALKTGQLFDFLDKGKGYDPDRYYPEFGHYSHGEVMLTMARAMGIEPGNGPSQLTTFGDPEFCKGEISELLTGS